MPNIPKYTLAIETATQKGSLSLLKGREEIGSWVGENYKTLSASLLPNIARLLSEKDLTTADLELIAVSAGPGSFTGVRVGLSTAKALRTALGTPAIAVPLTEALALSAGITAGNVIAIIPSGRTEAYWQEFSVDSVAVLPVTRVTSVKVADPHPREGEDATYIATSDVKTEDIAAIKRNAGKNVQIAVDELARYIGEVAIGRFMSATAGTEDRLEPMYVKEFRYE
jgi:tRNA threonylcarbamoyl adenosine modification protein YeaZ